MTILGISIDRDAKDVADHNIKTKMPAIKKEIEQWNRRSLTPIGRISIVKALLLSKLVHLFMALPNPSESCIKELERLLFRFVWGGKNDKVKRTKLVQNHAKDGLNMIQIASFIRSMKLSWLRRMSSNADWTILAACQIPNIWPLLSYGCKKLALVRAKVTNPFYVDLLDAIIQFNRDYKPSDQQILTERIGLSDWTRYETKYVKDWDDKGMRFLGDLYNADTGIIYSKQELTTKYKIQMTFLCYEALVHSLPQKIQKKVDKDYIIKPSIPYRINMVQNDKKFSKTAYKSFVENTTDSNKITNERLQTKWTTDIGGFVFGTSEKVLKATMSTYLLYLHF